MNFFHCCACCAAGRTSKPFRRAFRTARWPALGLTLAVAASGCASFSGRVLHDSRSQFNEMAQITSAEQLLLNIVRLRYASSPYFLEISSLSTSATMTGSFGATVNKESTNLGLPPNGLITPSVGYSQTPSVVFQPLTGEKLARQLLRPVDLRTLALLHTAGWDIRDVLRVLVDNINGISNARKAIDLAPDTVSENTQFRRVLSIIDTLEDRGLIQLGVDSEISQNPKDDVVLSLQIDPAAASLPEVQEFIRILALDPSVLTYRIAPAVTGGGGRNIAIRPRSILAAMRFLSKGTDVPESDAAQGIVSMLDKSGGATPQWSTLMSGIMHIATSESEPANAHVRVFYRGHWFYIPANDIHSQETFALIETAFAIQAGDSPPVATVLTLPIGR